MSLPSEVRRIQAALHNRSRKELEWSLWYARMRQSVPSARPADVKYWSAVEAQVQAVLEPAFEIKVFPSKKKKKGLRGLGVGPLPGNEEPVPKGQ
jgi:hypothetical protein